MNGKNLTDLINQVQRVCPEFDIQNDVLVDYCPDSLSIDEYRLYELEEELNRELEAFDASTKNYGNE